jgi:hypothetical protein
VRREEDRDLVLRYGLEERLQEVAPGERVERRDRLVEHEQLRPLREREAERHLRLLAAGERAGLAVERQAEPREPLAREPVVPARVELRAHAQQVADREAAVQRMVLRDEADAREQVGVVALRRAAEHLDAARRRLGQTDREVEERRLAGAVRPDERGHAAARDRQRAVAEGPPRAEALSEAVRRKSG